MKQLVFISAELSTRSKMENANATRQLKNLMRLNNLSFTEYLGCYKGSKEVSFAVVVTSKNDMLKMQYLKNLFNQESILIVTNKGEGILQYSDDLLTKIGNMVYITGSEAMDLDAWSMNKKTGQYITFKAA